MTFVAGKRRLLHIYDDFLTPETAPINPIRQAEPGPGTWAISPAAAENLSISNGVLTVIPSPTGPTITTNEGFDRKTGRMLVARVKNNTTGYNRIMLAPSGSATNGLGCLGNTVYCWGDNFAGITVPTEQNFSTAGWFYLATIQRTPGAWYLTSLDGVVWHMQWVDSTATVSPCFPAYRGTLANADTQIDFIKLLDIEDAWSTNYGPASTYLAGLRSAGDTFTHPTQAIIEFTVPTLSTTTAQRVRFRQQDEQNYWEVTINAVGNLVLNEVVAGVPTTRGSKASAVTSGARVLIQTYDTRILVYEHTQGTAHIYITNASTGQTATQGRIDVLDSGSISNLVVWPRIIQLPELLP